MEQDQETSLFGFGIDQSSRAHLSEAAKWAKFLSIVGFIMCGLIVVFAIFAGSILATLSSPYANEYSGRGSFTRGMGVFISAFYIGIGFLFFLPYLFLFRFANYMRTALNTNDQLVLNRSFQNLKVMFRYVGILTIIFLAFYGLSILVVLITAASGSFNR